MSYHCSQALAEVFSAQGFLDGKQSAELSGTRTAERSYFDGKRKGRSNPFPSGTTSEHSTASRGVEKWILFLPDSHVSPSLLQDNKKERTTSAICGLKLPVSFAQFDRDTASWKTSQVCLFTNTSEKYSKTWPRAAMIVDGIAYLRVPSAPRIAETDSGLLPTPVKYDATPGGPNNHYKGLGHMAKHGQGIWPTPRTITGGAESAKRKKELGRFKSGGGDLQAAVRDGGTSTPQTYPTPDKNMGCRGTQPTYEKTRPSGHPAQYPINQAIRDKEGSGQLNPDWVEWLMGWPIGWTALKPLETDKFRKWLELHGSY